MAKNFVYGVTFNISSLIDPKFHKNLKNSIAGLQKMSKAQKFMLAGGAMVTGLGAVTVGAIKAGEALVQLGDKFNKASNIIRAGTGATGKKLEELNKIARSIYEKTPADLNEVAQAVADYNTRMDVSGKTLQSLALKSVQASRIFGENNIVEASSKAFKMFALTEKEATSAMDYVFKVSQSTGTKMGKLLQDVTAFGPQLQALGYNFKDVVALVGKMDKGGYDATKMFSGLQMAMKNLAKSGVDAKTALPEYIAKIKAAKTDTEALQMATELFGGRAASVMAPAIRSGALDLGNFRKEIDASKESIDKAATQTYSFGELTEMLKHTAEVGFQPLAAHMLDLAKGVMPTISKVIKSIIPPIVKVVGALMPIVDQILPIFTPILQPIADVLTEVAQAVGHLLAPILGNLIKNLLPDLMPLLIEIIRLIVALEPAITLVTHILVWAISWITTPLAKVLTWFTWCLKEFVLGINWLGAQIKNFAVMSWNFLTNLAGRIKNFISNTFGLFKTLLRAALKPTVDFLNGFIGKVNGALAKVKLPGFKPVQIPLIPKLAEGGWTNGVSIAGEAGPEAVISMDPAYRAQNIGYWKEAGERLGALPSGGGTNIGPVTFAPQITINGTGDRATLTNLLAKERDEFIDALLSALEHRQLGTV